MAIKQTIPVATRLWRLSLSLAALALSRVPASAAMTWFTGYDFMAGPPSGPQPNSDNAHNNWLPGASAIGPIQICNWESHALGNYANSVTLTAGVTLTNTPGPAMFITDTATESFANGYNITPGGTKRCFFGGQHLAVPITYTFTFSQPIEAFSLYINGEGNTVQNATLTLNFTDANFSYQLPMATTIGCRYIGFVDPGQAITQVELRLDSANNSTQPYLAIDDIRWVYHHGPGCIGDVNGDGIVDLADLATLLAHFGQSRATLAMGDLNGDGVVELTDLALLLAHFGVTCD